MHAKLLSQKQNMCEMQKILPQVREYLLMLIMFSWNFKKKNNDPR